MIRMASEDGEGAIDLFGEDDTGQVVSHGHGAEREELRGTLPGFIGPAVGGTDGEDDELPALVALAAEPLGEFCGGHLFAPFVEEDDERRGAGALAVDG